MNGIISQEDDLHFLRQYSEYKRDYSKKDKITFQYINKELNDLKNYLPSELFQEKNSDFTTMIKLMLWVHNFLIPDGRATPVHPFNCINILEKTKTEKIKSNCWMFAVVLNEIYLSFGYRSKMIRCMPFDLRFNDCHCVVQVYVNEYSKWIMLDAAFGAYYIDTQKIPLNLKEIREHIIMNKKMTTPLTPSKHSKELLKYWTKNIFRFETYAINKFNMEENDSDESIIYSLLPVGYNLSDKLITHNGHDLKIIHTHDEFKFWQG